jgi:hypothetical protein
MIMVVVVVVLQTALSFFLDSALFHSMDIDVKAQLHQTGYIIYTLADILKYITSDLTFSTVVKSATPLFTILPLTLP